MLVAIDGPAASGKGTLGRRLAAFYGLAHLDTGLLYRATARALMDAGTPLTDVEAAAQAARELELSALDEDCLRGRDMGEAASIIAVLPSVRAALLALQRRFAAQGNAVLDGRDIGTVICPEADVKIYVTAAPEERARRRTIELEGREQAVDYQAILEDIYRRDARDAERDTAPLKIAADAYILDTTHLDIESVFNKAQHIIDPHKAKMGPSHVLGSIKTGS